MVEKVNLRHPISNPPKEFEQCVIYPHRLTAEYQAGRFWNHDYSICYYHVGLWAPWSEVKNLLKFPDDYEIGKVK